MLRALTLSSLVVVAAVGCGKKEEPPKPVEQPALAIPTASAASAAPAPKEDAAPSWITDLVVGTGATATDGKKISVHYTLWLPKEGAPDGLKQLESSHDKKKPKTFVLGAGQVLKGWDLGIEGMRVGGKRKLVVPPQLGYGGAGAPPSIPGNATLVFQVELVDVK